MQQMFKVFSPKVTKKWWENQRTLPIHQIMLYWLETLLPSSFSKRYLISFVENLINLSIRASTPQRKIRINCSQVFLISSVLKFSDLTLLNNFVSTLQMKSSNGNSTTTCSQWNKRSTKKKRLHGKTSLTRTINHVLT